MVSQGKSANHGQRVSAPDEIVYQYVGDGLGIPGLPHVITRRDAALMHVEELLTVSIQLGQYVPQAEVDHG